MSINRWSRKLHRWGAVLTAVPVLVVIVTGLLLQVKKEVTWVQPPTMRGTPGPANLDWETVLLATKEIPEANVASWDDIDRLDVRPDRSLIKVQCRNRWELQLDWTTGKVLHSAYRRSDWIETLHDGSFFGEFSKYYLFLPSGLILFGLWFTGAYLWYLPIHVRRKKRRAKRSSGIQANDPRVDQ